MSGPLSDDVHWDNQHMRGQHSFDASTHTHTHFLTVIENIQPTRPSDILHIINVIKIINMKYCML